MKPKQAKTRPVVTHRKPAGPFGVALREHRDALGISAGDLAADIGLTRAWLSKLELGQARVPQEVVQGLEKSLRARGVTGTLGLRAAADAQNEQLAAGNVTIEDERPANDVALPPGLLVNPPPPPERRNLRVALGISQKKMAELMGVAHLERVQEYETDNPKRAHSPTKHVWTLLELALGRHPRYELRERKGR